MALTGLDIYKLLPKKNCGECAVPTCLAFAMALAGKKTSLDKCPYVSTDAKATLEGASAPPQRLVALGIGENKIEIGNETVMFRHEQTFWHQPGIAVEIEDTTPDAELAAKIQKINSLVFERVAQKLSVQVIAVRNTSKDPAKFAKTVTTVCEKSQLALILVSDSPASIEAALKACAGKKPLIHGATAANFQQMAQLAKANNCPIVTVANTLDEMAELTPKVKALGIEDIVMDFNTTDPQKMLLNLTHSRRLAVKKTFRPLGYPTITFVGGNDKNWELAQAVTAVCKYAGLVVLKSTDNWEILPLLTARQSVYTDPRKPIQVESKIYEIGNVNENSPVLVTTNFSLTYFTVEPEVEGSKIAAYIIVVDTEGMSVLTAFAADKLNSEKIAKMLNTSGIKDKVKHKKVIIPGYVAVMSGRLQEDSGWEVMVGPREASAIGPYLKTMWKI
ncbi:MAG: acetyl-CoA decarbonylase/synthase complex subunit gamma [Planctomycetes bacterium]|nr:acetyl-CoA decarbonylase/synthase complex subunit gamma [Planctomycetota bacterium]